MGKSTGAGALALWTHHIKDQSSLDYISATYTGKAMKIGAGVQASEAQEAANAQGLVVVEGDCPTVGIAGGYTQGGGTSPLGSKFGLAADQVLEWEVVTGKGELLTATPRQNSDLYWALAGGGGGTYGVVLSVTVKLHPNMPTAGATLSFMEPSDAYWDILQAFLLNLPAVLDAGATAFWQVLPGNTWSFEEDCCDPLYEFNGFLWRAALDSASTVAGNLTMNEYEADITPPAIFGGGYSDSTSVYVGMIAANSVDVPPRPICASLADE
ncbi:hypothetical protein DL764_001113 [Monosporascus ibericus]|uniref:FAD-binding PCMH-type domain-containing protein n=1 Tax=Monosporascus ibericus TaxID=155417 RepID=A0A4Q4TU68_9PEZI|nr:hypothetical protein DL764_001113 [Monosporascus ibericus]